MAIHSRDDIRQTFDTPLWAARDLQYSAQKYQFTREGMPPEVAFQLVRDELMLDGNARQNMATFVQTYSDPFARELMDLSIAKNLRAAE